MARVLSAVEARANFSRILSEAYFQGEPTIVSRNKEPIAVIIGIDDYKEFLSLKEERARREHGSSLIERMRRDGMIELSTFAEDMIKEAGEPKYSAAELRQRTAGRHIPIEEIIAKERKKR